MITSNGKEVSVVPVGSHYKVQFKKGGELPVSLSGVFTSYGVAKIAIEVYLANKSHNKYNTRTTRNAAKVAKLEAKLKLEKELKAEIKTKIKEDK